MIFPLTLYIVAAVLIALVGDGIRVRGRDLDLAGYVAAVLALAFFSGVLGPTLDHHDEIAQDGRKTAYAATGAR